VSDAAESLTRRERRLALAAAIAAVTVFGLSIGEGVPLMSLLLERRGVEAGLNGLNAGAAFIGVLVGPLLTPALVRRLGLRNLLLACFVLDIAAFSSLKLFDGLAAWFVLRVAMGLLGSTIFTASEAWINLLAGDAGRGRVLGLYAAALSAGFGLGPLLLAITGIEGWAPFLLNNAISALAMLPLLAVGNRARDLGREPGAPLWRVALRAPFILSIVAVFGMFESALMSLIPVWGVRAGLAASGAAATLSAVYIGAIALQWPIGWLSDHTPRRRVLQLCGAVGLAGALLLAAAPLPLGAVFALLLVWGGFASGIYPVALGMAGERFAGGDVVAVNATMIAAYGLGAMVGPAAGGAAMDALGPPGLPTLFLLLFAGFLTATLAHRGCDRPVGNDG
jgi:MFS family permease